VADNDIFPEEMRTFLGLSGPLAERFEREHGELFDIGFWCQMQERNRRGEIIDIFPYGDRRRLPGG
jgi:isocitrate dehydrogenase kinase/phosphatase